MTNLDNARLSVSATDSSKTVSPATRTSKSGTPENRSTTAASTSNAQAVSQPTPKDADVEESISAAMDKLRNYVSSIDRNLEFSIDNDSGRQVVKIINTSTNEVVRQIPSDEALRIAKNLESARGIIFDGKV